MPFIIFALWKWVNALQSAALDSDQNIMMITPTLLSLMMVFVTSAFALEVENRPLVPTSASVGRSPAEAGLESGRYVEIPVEKLAEWEKQQIEKENAENTKFATPNVQAPKQQDFPGTASDL